MTTVAMVLAVALLVTALPAFAGEPQSLIPAPGKVGIRVSAERAVKALAPTMKSEPAARAQATTRTETRGSWAFFRSPIGVAIVAVVGGGVGYALYSTQHDRIHSAGKK
jgi:hypothetical protein